MHVPEETRGIGCLWSSSQLQALMWVLGIELRSLEDQYILLTTEPSLHAPLHLEEMSFILKVLNIFLI